MKRNSTDNIVHEIRNERYRQITVEGWSPAHDDEHEHGEMAVAAACYAMQSTCSYGDPSRISPDQWPWDAEWWRPKNPRRDLIRAAALIVAEIERLDRDAALRGQHET